MTDIPNTKLISLNQDQYAIIDADDYERVSKYKWRVHWNNDYQFYVVASVKENGKNKTLRLHRFIMNAKTGHMIDHINRNTLDNRKENLRFCTHSQNMANRSRNQNNTSSKYRGVHFCKRDKMWIAQISCFKKTIRIGGYKNEVEAAKAYDEKAKDLFGEFAELNFQEVKR